MKMHKEKKQKLGYINSPGARKKLSETWKKKWANGEVTEKQRNNLILSRAGGKATQFKKGHSVPESWREAVRKNRATQVFPKKDSSIEVKIQKFLKQLNIEFFTHQYMKEIEHSYQCDILIPSMNLIIECDGDYFHCNPLKYPANFVRYKSANKIITAQEIWDRDKIRTEELNKKGFKVLRLWEYEIKEMDINKFEEILNAKL